VRKDALGFALLETFSVFAVTVLLVHVLGREGALSGWDTVRYFSARVVYLPLYAAGPAIIGRQPRPQLGVAC
jgi:uncharacterized MAPEG superfamily protein